MADINFWAVLMAGVAAFFAGFGYYAVLGDVLTRLSPAPRIERPTAQVVPFELGKNLVIAAVTAGLVANMDLTGWTDGALLALALWIAFPVVVLASSVFHENVPVKLAALHAGDWLAKLLIIAITVAVWT